MTPGQAVAENGQYGCIPDHQGDKNPLDGDWPDRVLPHRLGDSRTPEKYGNDPNPSRA